MKSHLLGHLGTFYFCVSAMLAARDEKIPSMTNILKEVGPRLRKTSRNIQGGAPPGMFAGL